MKINAAKGDEDLIIIGKQKLCQMRILNIPFWQNRLSSILETMIPVIGNCLETA